MRKVKMKWSRVTQGHIFTACQQLTPSMTLQKTMYVHYMVYYTQCQVFCLDPNIF